MTVLDMTNLRDTIMYAFARKCNLLWKGTMRTLDNTMAKAKRTMESGRSVKVQEAGWITRREHGVKGEIGVLGGERVWAKWED